MDFEYLSTYRKLKEEYEALIKTSSDRKSVQEYKLKLKLLKKKDKAIRCALVDGSRINQSFL